MMRLTIPALAVIVIAAAVIMIRWPSAATDVAGVTAAMPSLQELHIAAEVHKLPAQEIDDQALVYTAQQKH